MKYILLILLVGYGLFMIIKPYECWRIEHLFDVKNGEPTDFAIDNIKGRGIGAITVGVILLLLI